MSCTFTLLRCVGEREDSDSPWKPERKWKAEVKDTTTAYVGFLDAATLGDRRDSGAAVQALRAQLTAFVESS